MRSPILHTASRLALGALLLGSCAVTPAEAQAPYSGRSSGAALRVDPTPGLRAGRYVVVIDLDANRLYFTRDRRVLWSAPVGTGTGFRMEHDGGEWDFSTPDGVYHVQFKEESPVWHAPDWYFIENDLPVPPANSPKRRFPGGLGAAAVFIGQGLAIHGTDKPELLGQRVSHGCIRLSNRDARRLFHNVQVGTEVVITGGRDIDPAEAAAAARRSARSNPSRSTPARDPFLELVERLPTDDLLQVLDEELRSRAEETRWTEVAGVLVRRWAKQGDGDALLGLMVRGERVPRRAAPEYATFVVDAFARNSLDALGELGRLGRTDRMQAARTIVEGMLALYPGDLDDRVAPWPTRRLPRERLDRDAERGWEALHAAERAQRERMGLGGARAGR